MQRKRIRQDPDSAVVAFGAVRQISLIVQIEQSGRLAGREKRSGAADEFERIPLRRIVAGRDGDAARRLDRFDRVLQRRSRNDADPQHLTPRGQQPGRDRLFEHAAGRTRIAPDHNAAAALIKTECRAEIGGQPGREPFADDAAHAAFGKFQRTDPVHSRNSHPFALQNITPERTLFNESSIPI